MNKNNAKKPKLWLVTFSTKNFFIVKILFNISAFWFGFFRIKNYSQKDVKNTDFWKQNQKILNQRRGAGYWLWKPYLILKTMEKVKKGDIIFYCDIASVFLSSPKFLYDLAIKKEIVLFDHSSPKSIVIHWTKRDCLTAMQADTPEYWYKRQALAGFQLYRNTAKSQKFVKKWLHYCQQEHLITNKENILGLKNHKEFIDHRHDQSILSILALKEKIEFFRDPSQFGYRTYKNSAYPQIFYLHRLKTNNIKTILIAFLIKNKKIEYFLRYIKNKKNR